jgi:glycosyltransferase involved in cell wall biosynthesis
VLNLGANAPALVGIDRDVIVHGPGNLPADEVARWLAAADLYLGPFVDGASTRRTTLMSAMQHGLPIVATDGPLTDSILRTSAALRLVPVDRLDLFAQVVRRLVESPDDRKTLGGRGRDLYLKHFDWQVKATQLLRALDALDGGRMIPTVPLGTSAGGVASSTLT